MKIIVHNIKGKETKKKIDLNKNIFGIEPNDHAIYLDVKQHLANKRKGNELRGTLVSLIDVPHRVFF